MIEDHQSTAGESIAAVTNVKAIKPKLSPVSSLIKEAIKVWRKNLMKFIRVYFWGVLFGLIPLAVMAVLALIQVFVINSLNPTDNSVILAITTPLSLVLMFVCAMGFAYFAIRSYIGLFLLVKKNYEGNELEIFQETKKYFWSYLWLSILTTVLILLWTLLLIIPGIIFSVFYSFTVYVYFFEDLHGKAAIKRSVSLAKGYWWPVFGRFVVMALALYIFITIISIPLFLSDEKSIFYAIWEFIVQIINFLIGPISMLYFYQIYQELVKIKK